jgi:dephospho-CoA kinase
LIVVGLTGSIGMGKSTTAGMFAARGIAVSDSDEIVHDLYRGAAVAPVGSLFPEAVVDGGIDRERLGAIVLADPQALRRVEAIVHPLVREAQAAFVEKAHRAGAKMVVLDIPLLFESGGEDRVDKVVVVTCTPELQRARVMARAGMTEAKFRSILARQVPDSEKRRRADFVIDTGLGLAAAQAQVDEVIAALGGGRREGAV